MSQTELVLKLFLQLAVILIFCRIIGFLGKCFFGQPNVVCEMIAGILLGPSLLGLFFPSFQAWLFPSESYQLISGKTIPNPSMSILYVVSQLGLLLYMFLVGINFDIAIIKQRVKSAILVSSFGIVIPFLCGVSLLHFIPHNLHFFTDNVPNNVKSIFLGLSLSITAFPVLARILEEKNANTSSVGTLALAAGSVGDLFAWLMIALLLSTISNNNHVVMIALIGAIFYLLSMTIIKKLIKKWLHRQGIQKNSTQNLSVILAILLICGWVTDEIGIYFIFGAFVVGVIMQPGKALAEHVKSRISGLTTSLLLPTFFVFSGLNTQVTLINSLDMWLAFGGILLAAIAGKGLGCLFAARLAGESWRESATIGALMNSRGLMELIIINIGLQMKIITHELFTLLVAMTIITTLMTAPLFNLIYRKEKAELPLETAQ